ncbi:MAG: tetratricopeptide repeat protein [Bacteroidaceae bacterium]|nr:tetratricopeptide repeat protein [Bacteroidaceae bacterium]
MKKVLFILFSLVMFTGNAFSADASKAEAKLAKKLTKEIMTKVREAKSLISESAAQVNINNAQRIVDEALKNQYAVKEAETYEVAGNLYYEMYVRETLKSYEKKAFDTVAMYNYLIKAFDNYLICDSIQHIPNAKGEVSNACRSAKATQLEPHRINLVHSGINYLNKNQNQKAYDMFDLYYKYGKTDFMKDAIAANPNNAKMDTSCAYFPTVAALKMKDYDKVLKYVDMACEDSTYGELSYQIRTDAYKVKGDTAKWVMYMQEGVKKYPSNESICMELIGYYNDTKQMDALDKFIEDMLVGDPKNAKFNYVKGYILYNQEKFEAAQKAFQIAVETDPKFVDAWLNLGLCYLIEAQNYMSKQGNISYNSAAYKNVMAKEKSYFQKARPCYEKVRELIPDQVSKWGFRLQEIYYKLNMSKEMQEVENQLKAAGVI